MSPFQCVLHAGISFGPCVTSASLAEWFIKVFFWITGFFMAIAVPRLTLRLTIPLQCLGPQQYHVCYYHGQHLIDIAFVGFHPLGYVPTAAAGLRHGHQMFSRTKLEEETM